MSVEERIAAIVNGFSKVAHPYLFDLLQECGISEAKRLLLEAIAELNIVQPQDGGASLTAFTDMTVCDIRSATPQTLSRIIKTYEERYAKLAARALSKPIIIKDFEDLKTVTVFSVSAHMCDRYPCGADVRETQVRSLLDRISSAVHYRGNQHPSEKDCLKKLNGRSKEKFSENRSTYFRKGCSATPDAIQMTGKKISKIAEFKSVKKEVYKNKSVLEKRKATAKRQLTLAMEATDSPKGVLVFVCGDQVDITEVTRDPAELIQDTKRLRNALNLTKITPRLTEQLENVLTQKQRFSN